MAAAELESSPEQGKRAVREVAQRVFAAEYNASNLEHKEPGDRSPTFVVTPLGARVNRLLVVGVLTANEPIGQTGEMWRAQITDPTGVFHVYAGQYQPEAARTLAELKPPAVVAIVGKSRLYSPEEGVVYTSIRPESIQVVDVADRDRWILETARFTLERLDCVRQTTALESPTTAAVAGLGYREDLAEGAVRALQHYGPPDTTTWPPALRDALEVLAPSGDAPRADDGFTPAAALPTAAAAPAQPAQAPPAPPEDDAQAELEERILAFVEKLDEGKGAPWKDLVSEAAKLGAGEDQVEEALNSLMDKGQVYEPVLGRIKRAD